MRLLKDKGYKQVSLSVQKANYAVKMYRKAGFEAVDEKEEEYIMAADCRGETYGDTRNRQSKIQAQNTS